MKRRRPKDLLRRIVSYFDAHEVLSPAEMYAWIRSCRKPPYSLQEFEGALYALRDEGVLQFTNGLWWRRK